MAAKRKKTSLKKPAKKPAARAKRSAASHKRVPRSTARKPLVAAQPQSKQKAAIQAGMFLATDDAWSLAYFDGGDLHCRERELFG